MVFSTPCSRNCRRKYFMCTCAYQEIRNVSFSENFAYVRNGWPHTDNTYPRIKEMMEAINILFLAMLHIISFKKKYFFWHLGPDKLLSCVQYVLEVINFTSCRTWLFSCKYVHKHNFSFSWVREAILRK